ncbi:5-oxoprolinase subunit B family protein [Streptomyces zingiberis]|uniref:Allophanate hydrolase subunit 1 n=1 Tax=Streptomyces zingiberis TaxID=2053010 RepID=A0ABX1C5R0_9ACTN|nr:allophanate hydrolase subunit 1 [Streptomyces zingiberis]NJQ03505.1 allophanate hydrolase subunit 1 [Streptomyces zingiberis]
MRALPVGRHALLVETGGPEATAALHAELERRRAAGLLPPVREIVPAERTVLLDGVAEPRALAADLARWEIPPAPRGAGREIRLTVRWDGPDLAEVAAAWRVRPEEVAEIVGGARFRVAFCGFAPGFGYLTGLPERYRVPRRPTPRTAVPAGSVALAGRYAGVYPRSSPGGWQLVGSTDAVLWDPGREPAALLVPGTGVRFVTAAGARGTGAAAEDAPGRPGGGEGAP